MRHALALIVLLPIAGVLAQEKPAPTPTKPAAGPADQERPAAAPSKKGDRIVIYGCLRGSSLEATDVGGSEDVSPMTQGITFRLTGDKKVLKELKEKHEKKLVEVHGTLKSDLQQRYPETKLGRVRIGIGSPSTGSASAADEAKRAVPVVEVASFTGRDTSCVR
jgi:hypothetical protein